MQKRLSADQLEALRLVPAVQIPNRVLTAMKLVDAKQRDLVEATGFTQPYVSDVLKGRFRNITVANAQRFADFFGCLIEDLFPVVDNRRAQPALPFPKKERVAS